MTDTPRLGTIEHIDPNQIEVEINVRTVVKIDPVLVASIREFGVLEPVVCRRTGAGISVRMGQRRVLAAREAERPTVPAYVVEGDDTAITRLVEQFAENEHRAGLTEPERAAVFQQLAFEGLSVPQIAKQTGVKKVQIEAGLRVAGNEFAGAIVTRHEITLDQAAALIEFEDDKDAVDRLVHYAEDAPEQFVHELQRQRDNRERAEAVNREQVRLAEAGFNILAERPSYDDKQLVAMADLITSDGAHVSVDDLVDVEAKFAHVRCYLTGQVEVGYYVADPKALGFRKTSGAGAAGPMSDHQKAERRALIANNKAWDSAEVVRRDWLATLLSRKTLPKEAGAFVSIGLTRHRVDVSSALAAGNRFAGVLLGLEGQDSPWGPSPVDDYADQGGKHAHVALAVVLAGMELALGRHTWRNPDARAARYLAQLEAWGYGLSEVEQIVTASQEAPEGD